MANYTENYKLEKPLQEETYNVDVFNGNMDVIDNLIAAISLRMHPVGDVYFTVDGANPSEKFGGTWERLPEDVVIRTVGADESVGNVDGSYTHTLTQAELPKITPAGTIANAGAHTHTGTIASDGAHTHTGVAASAGSHTHTGTAASAGAHAHGIRLHDNQEQTGVDTSGAKQDRTYVGSTSTDSAGAHTHSLSINSAGAHTHTVSVASNGAHVHTITIANAAAHTHTFTGTQFGGGQAMNIKPKSIAVYAWKRVA